MPTSIHRFVAAEAPWGRAVAIALALSAILLVLGACTPSATVSTMVPAGAAAMVPATTAAAQSPSAAPADAPLPAMRGIEEGLASWYGPGFAGRLTASGEVFNPNELTAAHKSLPFGTRVRVTSVRNGRSVVVRINDRGPFKPGRIIDLSRAGAEAIGLVSAGITRVTVAEVRGDAGAVRAGVGESLNTYEVISAGYPVGTLLVLSGVERSDRVIVRVVANGPEANGEISLLVSGELLSVIGSAVVIETE